MLAADQFLITPVGRVEDAARAQAAGDEIRTVIAGYHWFTDWGRDTMISLEGLTLTTGRQQRGRLDSAHLRALHPRRPDPQHVSGRRDRKASTTPPTRRCGFSTRSIAMSKPPAIAPRLQLMLPKLVGHRRAPHARARASASASIRRTVCCTQGQEGYQLTWMDAKVDDWVVTPRRGKAVEINALWYNALRLLEELAARRTGRSAGRVDCRSSAARARESFNRALLVSSAAAISTTWWTARAAAMTTRAGRTRCWRFRCDHPVLDESRWQPVLDVVTERLLTPVGLRSLAPGSPDYKPKYYGDLRARDAAYHQGTVWAWLIGPYIDAWLKVHPDDQAEARKFLEGFVPHLNEQCIGSISEVFDAEAPYTPRGCIAQAWSVAEVLRCWVKTENA